MVLNDKNKGTKKNTIFFNIPEKYYHLFIRNNFSLSFLILLFVENYRTSLLVLIRNYHSSSFLKIYSYPILFLYVPIIRMMVISYVSFYVHTKQCFPPSKLISKSTTPLTKPVKINRQWKYTLSPFHKDQKIIFFPKIDLYIL